MGWMTNTRCKACELKAGIMAYAAGLGASEWPAFIDRVPPCEGCETDWALVATRKRDGYTTTLTVPKADAATLKDAIRRCEEEFGEGWCCA